MRRRLTLSQDSIFPQKNAGASLWKAPALIFVMLRRRRCDQAALSPALSLSGLRPSPMDLASAEREAA